MKRNGHKVGPAYQGYSLGAGLERAVKWFRQKYGVEPVECKQSGSIILCGPIDGIEEVSQGSQSLVARATAVSEPMSTERALQLALEFEGVRNDRQKTSQMSSE